MSSTAADCSSAVSPRWRCSSDAKVRIKTLVDYYTHRLKSHFIDFESAQMWCGDDSGTSTNDNKTNENSSSNNNNNSTSNNNNNSDDASTAPQQQSTTTKADAGGVDAAVASDEASSSGKEGTASKKARPDARQLLSLAVKMARKGFEDPPSFLVPEEDMDPLPAHCVHLNILSVPVLKGCLSERSHGAIEDHLAKGAADFETLLYAFGDQVSMMSGDIGDDRDDIVSLFEQLSRLDNFSMRWSTLAKNACDFFSRWGNGNWLASTSVLFDSLPVPNAALFERAVAILFLTTPCLSTDACVRVCRALTNTADDGTVAKLLGRLSSDSMGKLLQNLQSHFTLYLMESNHGALNNLAGAMSLLYKANTAVTSRGLVPHTLFYNPTAIEFTEEAIVQDFKRSMRSREEGGASSATNLFCFSKYPCLVDTRFKSKLLQIEGIADAQQAQQQAFLRALFGGLRGGRVDLGEEMFCVLNIHRERLLQSTLNELSRKAGKFRQPLKVKFVGEQGIDAGGVTKEFFQLITKELLAPQFGMFTERSDERVLWFMPDVVASYLQRELFLVGQILGLAAYNSVIIDVRFPQLLYRKLLGVEPDMQDLKEIDKALALGLEKLLAWDEQAEGATVEDVFCRTFTYEHNVFDATTVVELVPGGKDMPLTASNRKEYVKAMLRYLLIDSIDKSFEQFKQGFLSVAARDMIATMHPVELETLLCGQIELDFKEMEESCKYEGLKEDSRVVQWFWKIVHTRLTTEQQKRLLHFCTGSDRVPVGGLKELHFVIGKNGDGDALLPTAHTCFNHLLLPNYSSEEVLYQKLLTAIENAEGFGLE